MSKNEPVEVEFGDEPGETATLLLAAAEELGLDAGVVEVRGKNFVVPSEVNDKAFGSKSKSDTSKAAKKTAKKAPAKKSQE